MDIADEQPAPVEVPYRQLSSAALRGVIESFVLREGTEYGEREHSLEDKVATVVAQLERGEARIMFEPQSRTVELLLVSKLGRQTGETR